MRSSFTTTTATLLSLLLPLCLTAPSDPSTQPPSLAHCECRCCHHTTHLRTVCASSVSVISLPPGRTCDSRLSSHDSSTCGPLLCNAHFPSLCHPPDFLTHACVSDTGFLRDWLPLVFAFCALLALAYGAASRAHTGPTRDEAADGVEENMAYKRDPVPYMHLNAEDVPLLAKGAHVLTNDGVTVEVVDVGPRSPLAQNNPNLQLLGSPMRTYSLPYAKSVSPMRTGLTATATARNMTDPRRVSSSPLPTSVRDNRMVSRDERVT